MNTELIALIMDVVVLVFLSATIMYVVRLSSSLKAFKQHRGEFDKVIADLLSSIDQAERSVATLKQASSTEAAELGALIAKSRALADELIIVNEAGEAMANRLEALAVKNGDIVKRQQNRASSPKRGSAEKGRKISSPVYDRDEKKTSAQEYSKTLKNIQKDEGSIGSEPPSFMIQDREFLDVDSLEEKLGGETSNDHRRLFEDDGVIPQNLQSQAERDLLEALRGAHYDVNKHNKR